MWLEFPSSLTLDLAHIYIFLSLSSISMVLSAVKVQNLEHKNRNETENLLSDFINKWTIFTSEYLCEKMLQSLPQWRRHWASFVEAFLLKSKSQCIKGVYHRSSRLWHSVVMFCGIFGLFYLCVVGKWSDGQKAYHFISSKDLIIILRSPRLLSINHIGNWFGYILWVLACPSLYSTVRTNHSPEIYLFADFIFLLIHGHFMFVLLNLFLAVALLLLKGFLLVILVDGGTHSRSLKRVSTENRLDLPTVFDIINI